jgi:hypothetical protein
MKKVIKLILSLLSSPIFKLNFYFFKGRNNNSDLIVLDIDNTLADTWRELDKLSRLCNYGNLPTLPGTIHEIDAKYSGKPRIFLSNRNLLTFLTTRKWLMKNNLYNRSKDLLILTSSPEQKLYFLRKLDTNNRTVFYYDDLSFNHENGEVKFYEKVIEQVKKMTIIYFDYNHILKLNSNDHNTGN